MITYGDDQVKGEPVRKEPADFTVMRNVYYKITILTIILVHPY